MSIAEETKSTLIQLRNDTLFNQLNNCLKYKEYEKGLHITLGAMLVIDKNNRNKVIILELLNQFNKLVESKRT